MFECTCLHGDTIFPCSVWFTRLDQCSSPVRRETDKMPSQSTSEDTVPEDETSCYCSATDAAVNSCMHLTQFHVPALELIRIYSDPTSDVYTAFSTSMWAVAHRQVCVMKCCLSYGFLHLRWDYNCLGMFKSIQKCYSYHFTMLSP